MLSALFLPDDNKNAQGYFIKYLRGVKLNKFKNFNFKTNSLKILIMIFFI